MGEHIPNNNEHLIEAYNLQTDQDARNFYNEWANNYDTHLINDLNYNAFEHVANDLAEVLGDDYNARILDIGAGTGLVGESLAKLGYTNIDGWDISEKVLIEARSKNVYADLYAININEFKPIKPMYDAAISCGTFTKGHVKHHALTNIAQILKPDAYFVCTINIGIWKEYGFKDTIEQLESDGIIAIDSWIDRSYFNDDTLECRCFLFRKL